MFTNKVMKAALISASFALGAVTFPTYASPDNYARDNSLKTQGVQSTDAWVLWHTWVLMNAKGGLF